MHVCILLVLLFLSVQVEKWNEKRRKEKERKEGNMKAEKVRRKKEKERTFPPFFSETVLGSENKFFFSFLKLNFKFEL